MINIKIKNRTTPDNITHLEESQIFVFGSNESGAHGAGAAKTAMDWGANWDQAEGLQGKTYAIPTVSLNRKRTLTVDEISPYVKNFIDFARNNPNLTFLVTAIGCGLAGLKIDQIAPLFYDTMDVENVWLPRRFWKVLIG
ncbi:hypothetical protein ACFL0J_07905 [Candidatus Neomarinimicrobiota bacterium]